MTDLEQSQQARRPDPPPFGLLWMRRFLPHYLKVAPSRLHLDLAADLTDFHHTRGQWRVYEAPRGGAKSTWLSKGYPLYCLCEGVESYTLMLSDTDDQAEEFLDAVKQEAEGNAALADAYPHLKLPASMWRSNRVRLANGCQIVAKGAGGRVRGRSNRSERPSLVVIDDANEKKDAYSPTLRQRKWDWFTRDVMSVGNARTNFLVAGTPIHREAISHRLRTTAGWRGRGYKAVTRWPDRMDLWAEWGRLLLNLSDQDANATARRFYEERRTEMDAGAEVLWPEWEGLYDLMKLHAAIGPEAFGSEKQDQPGLGGASEWPGDWFDDPGLWFWDWPDTTHRVQAIDPSKGATDRPSDFQGHAMLGLADGTLYLEVELRREDAPAMVTRSLDLAALFRPDRLVAEENSTMGFLAPEYARQLAERNQLAPLEVFTTRDNKEDRIRNLGGYLRRKQLRVRNTPGGREWVNQARMFPNGDYDDGLDSAAVALRRLEMLVNEGR